MSPFEQLEGLKKEALNSTYDVDQRNKFMDAAFDLGRREQAEKDALAVASIKSAETPSNHFDAGQIQGLLDATEALAAVAPSENEK